MDTKLSSGKVGSLASGIDALLWVYHIQTRGPTLQPEGKAHAFQLLRCVVRFNVSSLARLFVCVRLL